jgi:hydrogenase expression/formation protein HypC
VASLGKSSEEQMCLAVPGQIQEIYQAHGARMGKVNFGGVVKDVCLAYVPEIEIGDYTLVHVGFAISKIDETSALQTLKLFEEMGILDEELGEEPTQPTAQSCYVQPAVDPPGSNPGRPR